jgi:tol-pal system protein YbgF
MELRERDLRTESRLDSLQTSLTELDSTLFLYTETTQKGSQNVRALVGSQAEEQRESISLLISRQDEITFQIQELLKKLEAIQLYGGVQPQAATPPSKPAPSTPDTTSSIIPKTLYDSALEDIRSEKYALAESRFLSFLMQYPSHELASNAQYWLGEAAYGQKKFDLAISEFEKVVKNYPKSPKIPASLLKIGLTQIEAGKKKEGIQILNNLIKTYPNSPEANTAREKLK